MKLFKRILLGLLLVFVAIQFVRPEKNVAAGPSPDDLLAHHPAPPEVRRLLETACYDCHSNQTRYPWYSRVQPLAWWLAGHIRDGKAELNFSEFAAYSKRRRIQLLETSADEVYDQAMPLPSYTWAHADARLTPEQRETLVAWLEDVAAQIGDEE